MHFVKFLFYAIENTIWEKYGEDNLDLKAHIHQWLTKYTHFLFIEPMNNGATWSRGSDSGSHILCSKHNLGEIDCTEGKSFF